MIQRSGAWLISALCLCLTRERPCKLCHNCSWAVRKYYPCSRAFLGQEIYPVSHILTLVLPFKKQVSKNHSLQRTSDENRLTETFYLLSRGKTASKLLLCRDAMRQISSYSKLNDTCDIEFESCNTKGHRGS